MLADELRAYRGMGQATVEGLTTAAPGAGDVAVPTFVNAFWTNRQRAAHALHEVSYRACFKPQLPRFFIERLTGPGDLVYDPFMGRGTTVLEAALLGRIAAGNDVNPLSRVLVAPRLAPPTLAAIRRRLTAIDWSSSALSAGTAAADTPEDLLTFYHPDTLREIGALRAYLRHRQATGALDEVDAWIRMVAVNRLTGHSPGFFSVYTLPPNQAASVTAQRKINADRGQVPPRRDVPGLILRKSRALLADGGPPHAAGAHQLLTGAAAATPALRAASVDLVVTSPPFLDVVDYAGDNWLRCWFCGIDPETVQLTVVRRIDDWRAAMTAVFAELSRVVRPGGHIAFEVGEVRGGTVRLEEHVLPCGIAAGLIPVLVLINAQSFTKTAVCWGVANNTKGTNSNRIVLFTRP
jgi:hypothetical protein